MTLTLTPLVGIPLISSGDDLSEQISSSLITSGLDLRDGDILVLAQKIVSKAEGRQVSLNSVTPSAAALKLSRRTDKDPRLVELILHESVAVLRTRPGLIIVEHRLGFICANAGIDHSNVRPDAQTDDAQVMLLPKNPDQSAADLRKSLELRTGAQIGILIIDSHGRAWRLGTIGHTIGIAGVPGLLDLKGRADLYGSLLQVTEVGIADELAAAASILMGQAGEGTPVVHIRGFPYPLGDANLSELLRPPSEDLFR